MNYVLVPADKAAYNVVVVLQLYYINDLKRELANTNAYKLQPSLSERVVDDGHGCHTALHFGVKLKKTKTKFIPCTGYFNSINKSAAGMHYTPSWNIFITKTIHKSRAIFMNQNTPSQYRLLYQIWRKSMKECQR